MSKYLQKHRQVGFALTGLIFLTFSLYSNTWQVPLHLDDYNLFSELITGSNRTGWQRALVRWSFATNYDWFGISVKSFHIINTGIHAINACLIFLILRLLLKQRLKNSSVNWPAFAAAAIWLSHPLATQSVTYITQRYTSLAVLFYLAAIYAYCEARRQQCLFLAWRHPRHLLMLTCSLIFGLAAMLCKEFPLSLPFVLALIEYLFFHFSKKGPQAWPSWRYWLPISSLCAIPPFLFFSKRSIADEMQRWSEGIGSLDYFCTQVIVNIDYYIFKFFVPINLSLEHDISLRHSLLHVDAIGYLLITIAACAYGFYTRKRKPFIGLAAFWVIITLSPTSSFFANKELVAEQRAYLPLVAIVFLCVHFIDYCKNKFWRIVAPCIIVLTLCICTWQQNKLWHTEMAIWQHAAKVAPNHPRAHNNLGIQYGKGGNSPLARAHFEKALALNPDYVDARSNLAKEMTRKRQFTQGIALCQEGLDRLAVIPKKTAKINKSTATLYETMCGLYIENLRQPHKAAALLQQAIAESPRNFQLNICASRIYIKLNMHHLAIEQLIIINQRRKKYIKIYYLLAQQYIAIGNHEKAETTAHKGLKIKGTHQGLILLGIRLALKQGKPKAAKILYHRAIKLEIKPMPADIETAAQVQGW